jgi:hypothetical protein
VYHKVNTYFIPIDSNGFQLGKNYRIGSTPEVLGEATDIFAVSGPVARSPEPG